MEIRREETILGLLGTIEIAREQGNTQTMIRAAAEINKMLGFYPSDKLRTEALSGSDDADLQCLSDAQLLALIRGEGTAA